MVDIRGLDYIRLFSVHVTFTGVWFRQAKEVVSVFPAQNNPPQTHIAEVNAERSRAEAKQG